MCNTVTSRPGWVDLHSVSKLLHDVRRVCFSFALFFFLLRSLFILFIHPVFHPSMRLHHHSSVFLSLLGHPPLKRKEACLFYQSSPEPKVSRCYLTQISTMPITQYCDKVKAVKVACVCGLTEKQTQRGISNIAIIFHRPL